MSARSRQSHQLAQALTEHFGLPIELVYHGEPDRHGNGAWRVSWTDGPTSATMRGEAGRRAARFPQAEVARLGFSRSHTELAEAAALLAWLPQHPDRFEFLNSFTVDTAFEQTEFPERLDDQLQHRARALLRSGGGWLSGQALHLLAEHCRRGWEHAERWLDGLTAVEQGHAGNNVLDFSKARDRRREQQ